MRESLVESFPPVSPRTRIVQQHDWIVPRELVASVTPGIDSLIKKNKYDATSLRNTHTRTHRGAREHTHTHSIPLPVTGASKSIAASEQRLSKWNPKTMCSSHSSINHSGPGRRQGAPGTHPSSPPCSHTTTPCRLVTASPVLPGENPVRAAEVYPVSRAWAQWAGVSASRFCCPAGKTFKQQRFQYFPRITSWSWCQQERRRRKETHPLQKPIN